jgi:hypothetical protein
MVLSRRRVLSRVKGCIHLRVPAFPNFMLAKSPARVDGTGYWEGPSLRLRMSLWVISSRWGAAIYGCQSCNMAKITLCLAEIRGSADLHKSSPSLRAVFFCGWCDIGDAVTTRSHNG